MAESEENTEEVKSTFQPHFDYEAWREDKKPDDRDGYIAKGFDIFATKGYFYIVRSDLDRPLFMAISDLHNPANKGKIHDLPEAFQNGDHYFGDSGIKYVVQGNIIHCTSDLQTDVTPNPAEIMGGTQESQGGNVVMADQPANGLHYLIHKGKPYKIGEKKATPYSKFTEGGKKGTPIEIHEKLRDGLCYFALSDFFYIVKMIDLGGGKESLCFYRVKSLSKDPGLNYLTVNQSIQLFLPGGYTINNPSTPVWESIGYISNESSSTVDYIHEYKYSHGSDRTVLDSMEHHWDVELEEEAEASVFVAKASVTATQKYGGSDTHTTTDEWSQSTEETISFEISLEPNTAWALWQPTIKLGGQKTLVAGKHVTATDGEPPVGDPWA